MSLLGSRSASEADLFTLQQKRRRRRHRRRPVAAPPPPPNNTRTILIGVIILLVLLLLGFGGYKAYQTLSDAQSSAGDDSNTSPSSGGGGGGAGGTATAGGGSITEGSSSAVGSASHAGGTVSPVYQKVGSHADLRRTPLPRPPRRNQRLAATLLDPLVGRRLRRLRLAPRRSLRLRMRAQQRIRRRRRRRPTRPTLPRPPPRVLEASTWVCRRRRRGLGTTRLATRRTWLSPGHVSRSPSVSTPLELTLDFSQTTGHRRLTLYKRELNTSR